MKRRKLPFGICSAALLALVLTACAASGDKEKVAKTSVLNVVVGTHATWSAPRVLVTGATKVGDEFSPANPTSLAFARANGNLPTNVSGEALSMTVSEHAMDVAFRPVSIAEKAYDLNRAEKDGLEGLAHSMLSAGRETQDYARFGVWETADGDELIPSNALPGATYDGRGTPGAALLTVDTATSIGMTAGIEVERGGNFGVITGDIAVTANFASASIDRAINGAITPVGVDHRPAEVGTTLIESTAHNAFYGNVDLTDRARAIDANREAASPL